MFIYKVYNYTEKRDYLFRIKDIFSDEHKKPFLDFIKYYYPDTIVPFPNKKLSLKKKSERTCRFCSKKHPEVKFSKEAHVIPRLIGNRYVIHDSECDVCNEEFSVFDRSMANYIGMFRTIDKIKGYEGVPKFKSGDNKLAISTEKDPEGNETLVLDLNEIEPDEKESGSKLLSAKKQPYIPLHVMKCFYKMAYSLLRVKKLMNIKLPWK